MFRCVLIFSWWTQPQVTVLPAGHYMCILGSSRKHVCAPWNMRLKSSYILMCWCHMVPPWWEPMWKNLQMNSASLSGCLWKDRSADGQGRRRDYSSPSWWGSNWMTDVSEQSTNKILALVENVRREMIDLFSVCLSTTVRVGLDWRKPSRV